MNKTHILLFYVIIALSIAGCTQKTDEQKNESEVMTKTKAIDINDLDTTISPQDDFYQYATGGWQKDNPLPDEESRFGSFDLLAKETNKKVKDIIEELSQNENKENSIEWKIATFYKLGMDEQKIEKDKFNPIKKLLNNIDNISTTEDIYTTIAKLHTCGIPALFWVYSSADRKDSDIQIVYLSQGGLGLQNRDDYLNNDPKSQEIRSEYFKYISNMLRLANIDVENVEYNTVKIFDFEHRLAEKSMTNKELRNIDSTTNRMNISELEEISPDFDYHKYFSSIGLPVVGIINVGQPEFFKELSHLIRTQSIETWKIYFKWCVLNYSASYLHKEVSDTHFDFYNKFLKGTLTQRPRWRKIVDETNSCFGEAIGELFVKKYFPPEAKTRMEELVENLRIAFAERIDNLDWMSPDTKEKAKEKLHAITVKIGYPDKWRSYEKLEVVNDNFFNNILRSNEFEFNYMMNKVGQPVDKGEWGMTPQTVNAYYSPTRNEICFPAGILQPPFFSMEADDAVNYGAIGVVIGHEITHGFDDKGKLYDKEGNLNNWWTDEDAERFEELSKIIVERFNSIFVLDDVLADGVLTLGENIADYGGLKIAFDAFKKSLNGNIPEKIDGFTAEQRFYLAYAKIWGQNIRDEEIINRTKNDVHSLGKWRVNGQLPGIEDFHKAFNVKEGDPMFLPKEEWVTIW